MKVTHYNKVNGHCYDSGLEGILLRVVIGKNDGADNFCMRVIEFSPGAQSSGHSHPWEHGIFVHAGAGEIYANGDWHAVQSGSVVFIPGNEEHQIRNPGGEPLNLVCLVPAGASEPGLCRKNDWK